MARDKDQIREEVIRRGGDVLNSDIFRRIMKQKHHNVTVGVHCFGVAQDSVKIADALEKIGIHVDRDTLVRASLCHDLGMLNRYRKYRSNLECWVKHPGASLQNAREHLSALSKTEEDCILHHMWPMLPVPPRTLEGFIVCFADKKSAIREVFRRRVEMTDPENLIK